MAYSYDIIRVSKIRRLMNIDLSLQDVVYRLFHTLGAHVQTTRLSR